MGRRGPKPTEHTDWVAAAWANVITHPDWNRPKSRTKVLAEVGRRFGLGGCDLDNQTDSAVASELKRILDRYGDIIVKQLADELATRMG